jgi:hypothetical protein
MNGTFEPPRARSGLAKLRGDVAVPAPAPAPSEVLEPVVEVTSPEPEVLAPLEAEAPAPSETSLIPPVPAPHKRSSGRGPAVIVTALAATIVALLVVVLVNPFDSAGKTTAAGAGTGSGGTADERLAVVRAARQFTVSFFTYDYRKIDPYFRRIEAASSGAFRQDFVSKEKTLQTVVTQLKTVATGQVPDAGAGLSQLNGNNATALIAANFNASNAVTKNGQKRYRVKITLQRVKGVWLVTNFDQVV